MTAPAALYDDARALLLTLSTPHGILASTSSSANYAAVFTRDAVMAGIAGLLVDDSIVSTSLARTLEHLRALQGSEGQIASNYQMAGAEPPKVSFGSLVPRLDAPLWYLIGIALGSRAGVLDAGAYRDSVHAVVRLLDALEYNGRHLIYVPVGGDWADEYIYEGYVLHDQVLRAWALRLASVTFEEPAWNAKADRIGRAIEETFWTPDAISRGYPLAAHSPVRSYDMFDLATSSLLALSGVAPAIGTATLGWIGERFLAKGTLPPAFDPVIDDAHPDWPALRRYHLHGFRNRPHEYHNGGIWPIWLGWLALALARHGRHADLDALGTTLHSALGAPERYGFEEYLHGVTGVPGGVRQMAYSATGLVFLHTARDTERLALFTA